MDLISATKQVKADSKAKKNVLFYIILVDDEFEVRGNDNVDVDKDDVYSVWRGGTKIDSPKENEDEVETKTTKEMSTTKKTSAPKKAVAPKKVKAEKTAKAPKEKKVEETLIKKGASCFFTEPEAKALDSILKKDGDLSFNAWVNKLVFSKLK